MKVKKKYSRLAFKLAPIFFFGAVMLSMSVRTPMWMDEYAFYRLSSGLPEYSSTADWFFEDRPEMLVPSIDWEAKGVDRNSMFHLVYDTPIYTHNPLPTILVWPAVKTLDALADNGVISHIEDETGYTVEATDNAEAFMLLKAETMTNILRCITMGLTLVSLWLIFKILERKVGVYAYLFGLPIAGGIMMLYGAYLFYWDAFMMFFFVLTLYLMEVKPKSKWKYITACALVNTKMFVGIAFLFPLFIYAFKRDWRASWKMALPALSIIPFYIATVVVTGDPMYVFTHYLEQVPLHNFIYSLNSAKMWLLILFNMGMYIYIPLTLPILWYWKKYPAFAVFWLGSLLYAWTTGLGITHASTLVYAGALTFPLVAHEWRLIERVRNRFKKKEIASV